MQSRGGADDMSNLAAVHDRNPPHCHRAETNRQRAK
jgi:5-methylcytosine-specific restriction protein A